jgi:hypothetical protein
VKGVKRTAANALQPVCFIRLRGQRQVPQSNDTPPHVVILSEAKNPRPDPNAAEPAAETRCHGACPERSRRERSEAQSRNLSVLSAPLRFLFFGHPERSEAQSRNLSASSVPLRLLLSVILSEAKNPCPDPNPAETAAETRCHGACPERSREIPLRARPVGNRSS